MYPHALLAGVLPTQCCDLVVSVVEAGGEAGSQDGQHAPSFPLRSPSAPALPRSLLAGGMILLVIGGSTNLSSHLYLAGASNDSLPTFPSPDSPPSLSQTGGRPETGANATLIHLLTPSFVALAHSNTEPLPGINTTYDIVKHAAKTFGKKEAFGTRPVLDVITEVKDVKKTIGGKETDEKKVS